MRNSTKWLGGLLLIALLSGCGVDIKTEQQPSCTGNVESELCPVFTNFYDDSKVFAHGIVYPYYSLVYAPGTARCDEATHSITLSRDEFISLPGEYERKWFVYEIIGRCILGSDYHLNYPDNPSDYYNNRVYFWSIE